MAATPFSPSSPAEHANIGTTEIPTQTKLPGAGIPATPGGTPWTPGGTPTGIKPPGWNKVFLQLLAALVANPNYHQAPGVMPDDGVISLAEQLADRILARYPKEFGGA